MTDKQINRAIAEIYGWKAKYCTDLNAMHEAEKILTELQCTFFRTNLRERLESHSASRFIWHATARQRAEAFLRTLGKWEEVQP